MKKLTLLLLVVILFTGCGRNRLTSGVTIITNIEKYYETGLCFYYGNGIETNGSILGPNKCIFLDSCGKFNVGDTINIIKK